MKLPLPK